MDETTYKPNSHKYKEEQKELARERAANDKRVDKVVTGKVTTKQNKIRKFSDIFFAEDIRSIKEYIVNDVLIPATKRAFYDVIEGGLSMSLFGGRGGNSSRRSTADRVSYRDYNSISRNGDDRRYSSDRDRAGLYYDDIILDSRGDAEKVLSMMDDIMEQYSVVRVADLYDAVGITAPHTANNYGWTSIRGARMVREYDGKYRIEMPKALLIR